MAQAAPAFVDGGRGSFSVNSDGGDDQTRLIQRVEPRSDVQVITSNVHASLSPRALIGPEWSQAGSVVLDDADTHVHEVREGLRTPVKDMRAMLEGNPGILHGIKGEAAHVMDVCWLRCSVFQHSSLWRKRHSTGVRGGAVR